MPKQAKPPARRAKRSAKAPAIVEMTGEQFDALPDAEKERIYREIDSMSPEQWRAESRPPNAAERARLKRTDARMKRTAAHRTRMDHALERADVITRGLRLVMDEAS
jgi:hypothetical protein